MINKDIYQNTDTIKTNLDNLEMKVKINDSAEKLCNMLRVVISNEQFKSWLKIQNLISLKRLDHSFTFDFQNFANEQEKGEIYGLFFYLKNWTMKTSAKSC